MPMSPILKERVYLDLCVKHTREFIKTTFDVHDPDSRYFCYADTCHNACKFLEKMLNETSGHIKRQIYRGNSVVSFKTLHGSARHNQRFLSKNWKIEHCIVRMTVTTPNETHHWYIDAVAGRFFKLDSHIPDYYIGLSKPDYLLLNDDYWVYKGFPKWINNRLRLKPIKHEDGYIYDIGILDWFEYNVRGRISDLFYK